MLFLIVFFFKQKTAYEMRISDWSSDVCSSDLLRVTLVESNGKKARFLREAVRTLGLDNAQVAESRAEALARPGAFDAITARAMEIGRASSRERGCQYV